MFDRSLLAGWTVVARRGLQVFVAVDNPDAPRTAKARIVNLETGLISDPFLWQSVLARGYLTVATDADLAEALNSHAGQDPQQARASADWTELLEEP